MTTINFKNRELVPVFNFMSKLDLKNKESRARSKFLKLISNAVEELQAEEQALLEDYAERDGEGNYVAIGDQGNVKIKKETSKDYHAAHAELLNEEVVIEGGMYAKNIETIPDILNGYEGSLNGTDAEVYDRILDEFEKQQ